MTKLTTNLGHWMNLKIGCRNSSVTRKRNMASKASARGLHKVDSTRYIPWTLAFFLLQAPAQIDSLFQTCHTGKAPQSLIDIGNNRQAVIGCKKHIS